MNNNTSTLTKVLNSINNTLNIANKVVPIYKEAKPIINTVSSTYKTIKESGTDIPKIIKLMKLKNEVQKDMKNKSFNKINEQKLLSSTTNNLNNPKFFI